MNKMQKIQTLREQVRSPFVDALLDTNKRQAEENKRQSKLKGNMKVFLIYKK